MANWWCVSGRMKWRGLKLGPYRPEQRKYGRPRGPWDTSGRPLEAEIVDEKHGSGDELQVGRAVCRALKRARKGARGAAPDLRQGDKPPETPAPFPFRTMFQNGPRRQGCAPPRTNRA